ncbi:RNA 2',3'-cyclic phosphodiesterase [Deinococcus radiopugnans]|uniref:RNA 2',3'-cyclic phosphodiesterase n=1 Tax=Deinococcus radiopugnans ATCC 19172 TaxID=585398 RepID=A0A5C4Y527_9DEIO|nr:RNA 2',3'-cyclic phosphodiesterase [Deinococcus radiopugnans]MBB6015079.1 2'-5' RNA ligase [Deinococcus radiopugnans ATCC 19172]TNM70947.1 RNA 2',3'-cyclic phosphodiesterase [Deinococcus radiopugnans ATCC 19172]
MKIRKTQARAKPEKTRASDLDVALRLRREDALPAAPAQATQAPVQPGQQTQASADVPRQAQEQKASAEFRRRQEHQSAGGRRGRVAPEQHTPTTGRFFYALNVPASVTGPLSEAQRKLKGNWRITTREQMHVTLCYLPSVPLARVAELKALGTRLTQTLGPLDVRLRGTGYFPNEGSPRVWFVKVEAEGLDELAAALRAGVQALGIETEELSFKAHITLARKKGPAPRLPPLLFDLGWTAGGATLQRSHLQKTGPVYEQVGTFRFQAPAQSQPAAPPGEDSPHSTHHPDANSPSPAPSPEAQEPS